MSCVTHMNESCHTGAASKAKGSKVTLKGVTKPKSGMYSRCVSQAVAVCAAGCCRVLQGVAGRCRALQGVAGRCRVCCKE